MVTADDLGLTIGVTDGILQAHDVGIISNTGLMVNMPDAIRAAKLAQSRPKLSVGLHFNLTQGKPLSNPDNIPSLVTSDGSFKKLGLSYPRNANPNDIETELVAQIDRFYELGFSHLHIDGHHYVTFIPAVMRTILKLKDKKRIKTLRMPDEDMIKRGVKRKIIGFSILCLGSKFLGGMNRYIKHWRKLLSDAGFTFPDELISWQLFGENDPEKSIIRTLSKLSQGTTEIFGHPGIADYELRSISSFTDARERELVAFTSQNVKEALVNSCARLINAYELGG